MQTGKIIVIAGPTASGKSALAIDVALFVGGVVINADSMQLYKDMPVITAAPTDEDRTKADHRLFEIYDPSFKGNVVDWLKLVVGEIKSVWDVQTDAFGRLYPGKHRDPETHRRARIA